MSLNTTDYVPNPHIAYCKIWINGTEITTESERPQRLMGFSYVMNGNIGGNRTNFTIFDEKWTQIEQLLSTAYNGEIEFQFGYTTGRISPKYKTIVFSYKPTFLINGMQLLLEGVTPALAETKPSSQGKQTQDRQEARSFPGVMGKEEAEIHEIVKWIADKNDWDSDIEDCESVFNNDDLEKSGPVKMHFSQPAGQRDFQFIMEQLAPLAKSKKDKSGDYKVFFDDPQDGGKCKLHFHPPRFQSGPDVYIFMQDKMSEVIQFSPEIIDALNLKLGGGVSGANCMDQQTGTYDSVFACNANTPEKTILGGSQVAASDPDKEKFSRLDQYPYRDKAMAENAAREHYLRMFNSRMSGEIIIQGNPKLKIHEICNVAVVLPNGTFHYTSGLYFKLSATHELNGGRYTTTISLIRSGHDQIQGSPGVGNVIKQQMGPPPSGGER